MSEISCVVSTTITDTTDTASNSSMSLFGWLLVRAASNNDIELLLAVSVVSVIVVLTTQLISDIGYVVLNPRIRIT